MVEAFAAARPNVTLRLFDDDHRLQASLAGDLAGDRGLPRPQRPGPDGAGDAAHRRADDPQTADDRGGQPAVVLAHVAPAVGGEDPLERPRAQRLDRGAALVQEDRVGHVADAMAGRPQPPAEIDVLPPGRPERLVEAAEPVEDVGPDHQAGRRRLFDVGRCIGIQVSCVVTHRGRVVRPEVVDEQQVRGEAGEGGQTPDVEAVLWRAVGVDQPARHRADVRRLVERVGEPRDRAGRRGRVRVEQQEPRRPGGGAGGVDAAGKAEIPLQRDDRRVRRHGARPGGAAVGRGVVGDNDLGLARVDGGQAALEPRRRLPAHHEDRDGRAGHEAHYICCGRALTPDRGPRAASDTIGRRRRPMSQGIHRC